MDGHQMYSGEKALTIGIDSPTPPLIFTGGQKVRNLASFSTSLANRWTLSRPRLKMQQDIRTVKQNSCVAMHCMSSPSLVKLDVRTPENRSVKVSHPIQYFKAFNSIFTALHEMQTRSSDENSVRPSVRLSVCPSVRLSHACIVTKR